MVTQEINLNLIPGGVPPVVNVSQYDKGSRVLEMHLYLGTEEYQIPDGTSVFIQGTKLDGNGFLYECEYDGNIVTADVTDQMTVLPGAVRCEVFLQEETEKRIGSANFAIVVERATLQDPEDHLSETEIPLIGTLAEAALKAMSSEKAAAESESNAKTSETNAAASQKAAKASETAAKASQSAAAKSESNAKTSEQNAAASEKNAKASETAAAKSAEAAVQSASDLSSAVNIAKSYAVGGTGTRTGEDADNAKYYAEEVGKSEEAAAASQKASADSQSAAKTSETNAAASAKAASASQSAAAQSESNAKTSEQNAATSEKNAKTSESNALTSSGLATTSYKNALSAENKAESYAVGGTGTRTGEDTDNAKYYASEAKNAAQEEKGNDLLEASGAGFILDNSADAAFHSLTVEGKSTQKQYAGYNICGGEYLNQRWWARKDLELLAILNSLPAGTYRALTIGEITSVDSTYDEDTSGSLMYGISVYASGSHSFSAQDKYPSNKKGAYQTCTKTFTITEDNKGQFTDFYEYSCGASKDGVHGRGNLWVMITSGEDEYEYEPYVGGKASPNVDYPQDIIALENEKVTFRSKNILSNAGPFEFNSNAGPTVIDEDTAKEYLSKFYGKNAYVSFDIEASSDFESGGNNRFGMENTIKDSNRVTYYAGFQLWYSGTLLEAGKKKHLSGVMKIGKDVRTDVEITNVGAVYFYVQCISEGSITVSNLQMEIADSETDYETPKSSTVAIPYTLRSIGDIHDELTIREDGTGELIQRVWHRDLPIKDMNNTENYPGWIFEQTEFEKIINKEFNGTLSDYGLDGYCSVAKMNRVNVNTYQRLLFLSSLNIKQSVLKENYADLVVTLDLPYINPVVSELTADEVAAIMTAQTYSPQTVVYTGDDENITLQYYNATVQGGQDQISNLRSALSAEAKRAGDAENEISETLTADEKILNGLSSALGTLEVKSFSGTCTAAGNISGVGRIATFPSYPVSLWLTDKLDSPRSLILSTHAYSDGWFVTVTDSSGTDITDLELTIKALIATPAASE